MAEMAAVCMAFVKNIKEKHILHLEVIMGTAEKMKKNYPNVSENFARYFY